MNKQYREFDNNINFILKIWATHAMDKPIPSDKYP